MYDGEGISLLGKSRDRVLSQRTFMTLLDKAPESIGAHIQIRGRNKWGKCLSCVELDTW